MIERTKRLPYTRVNRDPGSASSVVLMSESTGVIPLPATNAT